MDAMTTLFTMKMLLLILGGVTLGLIFGAIPGLTATLAIALIIPLTFSMQPIEAMAVMGALYIGGISGGLVSATLINMPGTPSSVCTTFDAHPMAKQGMASEALSMGVFSSFFGGIFSWVVLVAVAPQLAKVALGFGPYEYFLLTLFGLTVVISLGGKSIPKAFLAVLIGIFISMIGMDPVDGMPRFTFGIDALRSGFDQVPALMGFFVVAEILLSIEDIGQKYIFVAKEVKGLNFKFIKETFKESIPNYLRASAIGTFLGILPGIGGATANFVCYDVEKKLDKHPEKFGTGYYKGIIASETGNNAVTGGALIPMLTLGIPGDGVTAVMLGALLLHDVKPGPMLFSTSGDLVAAFFGAVLLANIAMILIQWLGGIKFFIKVLTVPRWALLPMVLVMVVAGIWTLQYNTFDLWTMLILGLLGYFMKKLNYPISPVILGIILGPMMEDNLRRALIVSQGSWMPFVTRPYSLVISVITIISIASTIWFSIKMGKNARAHVFDD